MTNKIAFILGFVIVAGIVYDVVAHDSANLLFLAKKLLEFIEWMAFWR